MPTLIEYLATREGRLHLLAEGYLLRNTVTGDHLSAEKLAPEVFRNIDCERLLPLFDESVVWEAPEQETQDWVYAEAYLRSTGGKVQCDQNTDVYLQMDDRGLETERFQFYNVADDTVNDDYEFIPSHFEQRCWTVYGI